MRTRCATIGASMRASQPTSRSPARPSMARNARPSPGYAGSFAWSEKSSWRSRESTLCEPSPRARRAEKIALFARGARRREETEASGAAFLDRVPQHRRRCLERGLPRHRLPAALHAHHRLAQPVRRVDAFVREAVAVRDPGLVDLLVGRAARRASGGRAARGPTGSCRRRRAARRARARSFPRSARGGGTAWNSARRPGRGR